LITAGVYSLVGAEVSSATVAAFLTILGYSLYDTVIVFDRIRENVPRLPRAAFSQIVNRSMSEVLTRSLITGLSTVFLITVLLLFGGETLQAFALAMLVGVASGTYSSIFIASPVLTAWKEREPQYRARRRVIQEAMGRVPPFPEENVVARLDEEAERAEGGEPGRERAGVTDGSPRAPGPPEVPAAGDGDGRAPEAEPAESPEAPAEQPEEVVAAGATAEERAKEERRAAQRARRQRRRRKHGRHR
jgi:SecD/SecF fusion protein